MAGWKALTDCLKTGGLMCIGLYNGRLRGDIVQIRDEIKQSNIDISSHDAMKSYRSMIVSSEEEHHKRIVTYADFYNMSALRDLLFHVHEHLFTIPQIEASLSSLGLTFCGFEDKKTVQNFKMSQTYRMSLGTMSKNFKETTLYDLKKWNTFEDENPYAFYALYLFWCQKV